LPPARELGVLVSFGIIVAFILSMTFLPAALKILPFLVHIQNAEKSGRFDKLLQLWGNYFARHNIGFLVVVGIIILIIATGIKQIKVDTNPIYFWDKNYEIRRSNDFIARFVNR
jgi:predicted RND superfamily exporter protein